MFSLLLGAFCPSSPFGKIASPALVTAADFKKVRLFIFFWV
jgi:hypothetical protein